VNWTFYYRDANGSVPVSAFVTFGRLIPILHEGNLALPLALSNPPWQHIEAPVSPFHKQFLSPLGFVTRVLDSYNTIATEGV